MGSAHRQQDGYYNLYFVKDLMAPNNIIVDGPRFKVKKKKYEKRSQLSLLLLLLIIYINKKAGSY